MTNMNPSIEWLRKQAAIEDESFISVGGLVSQLEEAPENSSEANVAHEEVKYSSSDTRKSEANSSLSWLREKAAIEDENLVSAGGLLSRLQGLNQPDPSALRWHETKDFAELCRSYIKQLEWSISASESILPEQRCDLRHAFVIPTLLCLNSGSTTSAVTSALKEHHRFFLSAEPGAGKTCLFRFLALQTAHHFKSGLADKVPVYLSLREWPADKSFEGFLYDSISRFGISHLREQFTTRLKDGGLTLFLDGVDEVLDERRQNVLSEIRRATEVGTKCHFFVSSRSREDSNSLHDFENYGMAAPSVSQVFKMLESRFKTYEAIYSFQARVRAEADLRAVLSNPLLLTLIAGRYRRNDLSPHDLTNVFSHIVDALVDTWDATRGVVRSQEPWAAPNQKLSILKRIAAELVSRQQQTFTSGDFKTWVEKLAGSYDHSRVLDGLVEHTGILERVSDVDWAFRHVVYRDFLAASFSIEKCSGIEEYTRSNVEPAAYRRLLRFLCGRASDATDVVSLISGRGARPSVENAVVLADALGQNLSIDKTATENACLYVVRVLEDLLRPESEARKGVTVHASKKSEQTFELNYPNSSPESIWTAEVTSDLLNAVSRARDGVGKDLLAEKMEQSAVGLVKDLGANFRNGGRLNTALTQRKTQLRIQSLEAEEDCFTYGTVGDDLSVA